MPIDDTFLDGTPGREALLNDAWTMTGEVVRQVAGRETLRVSLDGRTFYLKRHRGVGWSEVLKNWLVLKRPVTSARNEYAACKYLEQQGITAPTVAAFAESNDLAPYRSSFVLCDALVGYNDLEALTLDWARSPASSDEKLKLLRQVAKFAARFHEAGLVHRDFYLCHLLKSDDPECQQLGVLDLHRALIFSSLPDRWRQRDLAALLFSTLDLNLSKFSWLRFVRIYTGRPLKEVFSENAPFWHGVYSRAMRLYRKGARKGLTTGHFRS
jgi:heptose I phosphotransferase